VTAIQPRLPSRVTRMIASRRAGEDGNRKGLREEISVAAK
jgi:hypothetical protein